jgi:hypothetical protein
MLELRSIGIDDYSVLVFALRAMLRSIGGARVAYIGFPVTMHGASREA